MPKTSDMGHSEQTETKHSHYRYLIATHTQIVKQIFDKNSRYKETNIYLHFDITPGDGGEYGQSPVIFVRRAQELGLPYRAIFIEQNAQNARRLKQRLMSCFHTNGNTTVDNADHIERLPYYFDNPPVVDSRGNTRYVYGSLYVDPNGEPPWKLLSDFSEHYPMVDVIIHLSGTTTKRRRGVHGGPDLIDCISGIQKRHWIVRYPNTCQQWTFVVGTNWDGFPELKQAGMVSIYGKTGREYLSILSYSKKELSRHIEATQNTSLTQSTGRYENKPLPGLAAYVNDVESDK